MRAPSSCSTWRRVGLIAMAALALGGGCRRQDTALQPVVTPGHRVTVFTEPLLSPLPVEARDRPALETLVTIRAADAPVRSIIEYIAREAGLNIVVAPEVAGLVTVNVERVTAREALETVLRAAGLGFVGGPRIQVDWNPTIVFYDLPVHIDSLSSDAIMRRFGVSREMADLIVRSRIRAP